jgi:predicted ATPase
VERFASDLIELSTRHQFAYWLAGGEVLRGWARSASGDTTEGLSRIEDGIVDWRATGSKICVPYWLGLKAEALHLADRTFEALEAISEAEAVVEGSEDPTSRRVSGGAWTVATFTVASDNFCKFLVSFA